jgi:hypothetical protein
VPAGKFLNPYSRLRKELDPELDFVFESMSQIANPDPHQNVTDPNTG